jgi:hypothetical protein
MEHTTINAESQKIIKVNQRAYSNSKEKRKNCYKK